VAAWAGGAVVSGPFDAFLSKCVSDCVNAHPGPADDIGTKCWECSHARGEHDEKECRGGEDLPCRCDSFIEPIECQPPHQGCGCERDASQGAHAGPCEYEDGYGDWPYTETRCVKCCAAIRENAR